MIKVDRIYVIVNMALVIFHKQLLILEIFPKGVSGKSCFCLIELPIELRIELPIVLPIALPIALLFACGITEAVFCAY